MSVDPVQGAPLTDASLAFAEGGRLKDLERAAAKGGEEGLKEVASQFEAVFLGLLLKQMWESVEKSDLFPESPGKPVYDGLITTMLADHLASNGGIGIADAMVDRLKDAVQAYDRTEEAGKIDRTD